MLRAFSLLAMVSLMLVAPASASMTATDLAAVLPIARDAWPASKCRGLETAHLNADDQLAALTPDGLETSAGNIIGHAEKETCEVWVSQSVTTRMALCDILAHEFGHLALTGSGGDHTATGVMAATDAHYEPCGVRFGRAWAESLYPHTRCVLATVRARARTYHCGRRRYAVVSPTATYGMDR